MADWTSTSKSLARQAASVCQVPWTLSNWLGCQAKSSAKSLAEPLSPRPPLHLQASQESMMRNLPIFCHLECFQTQDCVQETKVQEACLRRANRTFFFLPLSKYCWKNAWNAVRKSHTLFVRSAKVGSEWENALVSWWAFLPSSPLHVFVLG